MTEVEYLRREIGYLHEALSATNAALHVIYDESKGENRAWVGGWIGHHGVHFGYNNLLLDRTNSQVVADDKPANR